MRIWWPAQRAGSETVMMTKAPSPLDSDFALEQICGSQRPWMLSQKSGANYSLARVNRLAIRSDIANPFGKKAVTFANARRTRVRRHGRSKSHGATEPQHLRVQHQQGVSVRIVSAPHARTHTSSRTSSSTSPRHRRLPQHPRDAPSVPTRADRVHHPPRSSISHLTGSYTTWWTIQRTGTTSGGPRTAARSSSPTRKSFSEIYPASCPFPSRSW